jgi:predicted nucleic acid-binding Zn ribbon protein
MLKGKNRLRVHDGPMPPKRKGKEIAVPRHSHCLVCGVALPENATLCSEKCRSDYENMIRRQKYFRLATLLPPILVIISLAIFAFGRGLI